MLLATRENRADSAVGRFAVRPAHTPRPPAISPTRGSGCAASRAADARAKLVYASAGQPTPKVNSLSLSLSLSLSISLSRGAARPRLPPGPRSCRARCRGSCCRGSEALRLELNGGPGPRLRPDAAAAAIRAASDSEPQRVTRAASESESWCLAVPVPWCGIHDFES